MPTMRLWRRKKKTPKKKRRTRSGDRSEAHKNRRCLGPPGVPVASAQRHQPSGVFQRRAPCPVRRAATERTTHEGLFRRSNRPLSGCGLLSGIPQPSPQCSGTDKYACRPLRAAHCDASFDASAADSSVSVASAAGVSFVPLDDEPPCMAPWADCIIVCMPACIAPLTGRIISSINCVG